MRGALRELPHDQDSGGSRLVSKSYVARPERLELPTF
jgi:hypothetical protein